MALTANAMPHHRELCRAAGMDDFLPKPVDLDRLASRIAQWLRVAAHAA